jgi:diaminopimelate epimerase
MLLSFAKMHGLGNDFMMVDGVSQQVYFNEGQIRRLADRNRGVGFDQLILVEPPQQPDIDFHYRIFNANGSEVGQCGNGVRCLAKFARKMGLTWKNNLKVSTNEGTVSLYLLRNGLVSVDMGVPQLSPQKVPLTEQSQASHYQLESNNVEHQFGAVSMGNPHCVLTVDDIEKADVDTIGGELTQHSMFPEGANIGFMQIKSSDEIKLRVYERGVGETLACGTGACASAVVARLQHNMPQKMRVFLPGGHLHIDWPGEGQPLRMMGPAEFVYQGYIEL